MLEQKDVIDTEVPEAISKALKIPTEAFRNFNEEQAINIISNTFNDGSFLNTGHSPIINLNPIEILPKLYEQKITLYERMLKEKEDTMNRLEKLIIR